MYLAFGARILAAGALGIALAGTAAAGVALTPPGPAPARVIITPGVRHIERESRQGPSTTAQCEQSIQIACYNPAQIEQAYSLPALPPPGVSTSRIFAPGAIVWAYSTSSVVSLAQPTMLALSEL